MKVGDRIKQQPVTFGSGEIGTGKQRGAIPKREKILGTVTYISKRGWYQVTFDNGVRECFFPLGG